MIEYIFLVLFLIDSIIHLLGVFKGNRNTLLITKPLLMPLLALYFIFASLSLNIFSWLIVAALISGFAGDTFLMFGKNKKFFLFGMGAFLIGHIFYIISFMLSLGFSYIYNSFAIPLLLIPVIIIFYQLLPKIKDGLGEMKIPVYAYMVTILYMHFSAILRTTSFPLYCPCFLLVYVGSILFILSDAFIAYDEFNEANISKIKLYIMITYILAQFLIVQGILLTGI